MRVRKQSLRFVFGPESLETRDMLSGNGLVSATPLAAHTAAGAANQSTSQFVSSVIAGLKASHAGHHLQTSLSATLTDPTNSSVTGTVTYLLSKASHHGTPIANFNVSVSGAAANSTLDVAIGGVTVGQIMTDVNGAGSLALSSNPSGSQQALPANFPTTVSSDSVVTVGTLSGTLATMPHRTMLTAQLTGSTGTETGTATFRSNTEHGKTNLSVSLTGLQANSTLDVTIGGTVVGQVTTNRRGEGRLRLKNLSTTVNTGSTITVGTLSGTFATSSSNDGDDSDFDSD